ncbi:aromatic ring-hydroxylating dioxygenase subunit alpha [Paraburkholderia sp. BCC1885]|uniref:aromatic ring-hydroxylating dioxygenase subunit alpha n=1 Tax=Paraburkholderia sp. BCC1885 TaxID=2562669 RepID=UPI0021B3F178|nr:aromatic ring-hydroxylating dioxygenase subunit alpha [Paraburkholderia sp. BCC1885]
MLTASDNRLLTLVEGDAPMGAMLRSHYWVPAAISEKLVSDGAPLRVRLVGRDYVVFRSTDGRVGCFDERCPHRSASLALARNEDNALRCIFHGWKFSVDGKCVEVPTEVSDQKRFCESVPIKAHPTREASGIVWVWLGDSDPAVFPSFEFMGLPECQRVPMRQALHYNWLQGVEGTMDSAHVGVLHTSWLREIARGSGHAHAAGENRAPRYEIDEQPYGFRYAAHRSLEEGGIYTRVNVFVMPWFGFICPGDKPDGDRTAIFSVPADNEHSVHWMVKYNPYRELSSPYQTMFSDPANWPPAPGTPENVWGQDRELMRHGSFTGFTHVTTEDFAVASSAGPIADRTNEFLNSGDLAIVRLRRQLLNAVREFEDGRQPTLADHAAIDYGSIRPVADKIAKESDWRSITA